MAVDTNSASELTAEQVQKILVKPLEESSVFLAAGPRIFDTDGSVVRVPKAPAASDDADIKFTGENELIGEADPEFDELTLLPSGMKSVKVLTRFSNELARQSVVALDAALRDRLVADVAAKLDRQFLGSTGDGVTVPKGLFAWTGVNTVAVGGALTLDALLDGYGLALGSAANVNNMTLFVRPADYMALRKIKDTTGRFLVEPNVSTGGLVVPALNAKVQVSTHVAANSAALVDMSQVAVARDMAPTVTLLKERYADYDQQALRVVARYDAGAMNPEAVTTFTGLSNTP